MMMARDGIGHSFMLMRVVVEPRKTTICEQSLVLSKLQRRIMLGSAERKRSCSS